MEKIEFGRRSFLKTAAAVVGVEVLAGLRPANAAAPSAAMPEKATTGGPMVVALDNEGVVETMYGKVRGSQRKLKVIAVPKLRRPLVILMAMLRHATTTWLSQLTLIGVRCSSDSRE